MRSNEGKTPPSPSARTGHPQNLLALKGSAGRDAENIHVRQGLSQRAWNARNVAAPTAPRQPAAAR